MIPLGKAQKIAERVAAELRPFAKRIEIAGSIRRGRAEVGDVDLVIEASDRRGLEKRVEARCKIEKDGEQYLLARMADGTQLDLWFSHSPVDAGQADFFGNPTTRPENFGSLLLCRTGSPAHNIALCERAKTLGLRWNPHWGIYRNGGCLASKTEEDIYQALGLPFIPPDKRELAGRDAQQRLIHRQQNRDLSAIVSAADEKTARATFKHHYPGASVLGVRLVK